VPCGARCRCSIRIDNEIGFRESTFRRRRLGLCRDLDTDLFNSDPGIAITVRCVSEHLGYGNTTRFGCCDQASCLRPVRNGRRCCCDTQDQFVVVIGDNVGLVTVKTFRTALTAVTHVGVNNRHDTVLATPRRILGPCPSSGSTSMS